MAKEWGILSVTENVYFGVNSGNIFLSQKYRIIQNRISKNEKLKLSKFSITKTFLFCKSTNNTEQIRTTESKWPKNGTRNKTTFLLQKYGQWKILHKIVCAIFFIRSLSISRHSISAARDRETRWPRRRKWLTKRSRNNRWKPAINVSHEMRITRIGEK